MEQEEAVTPVCIDMELPEWLRTAAAEAAVAENAHNLQAPDLQAPGAAASGYGRFWQPGRVLPVRFLEGDPVVQARVAYAAQEWSDYAACVRQLLAVAEVKPAAG